MQNFNVTIYIFVSFSPSVEAANHMADRVQQRELEAQQVKTTLAKDLQHRRTQYHSPIMLNCIAVNTCFYHIVSSTYIYQIYNLRVNLLNE